MEVVGKRIQALRKEHKMTQQQLAEAIDISEKYLSNIETGKDICSIHVILNIANLLDASVDDLLGSNPYSCKWGISYPPNQRNVCAE